MKTLDAAKAKERVRVSSIEGSVRLLTRLSSIGLVPGSVLEVVRNDR
ncbi:MAG: ferrous iron transport protein A, partial [Eggerthellaceae bacterium]|nr:ferrous iron transport protein A [Eggerthellaceae bacterium]